MRLPLQTAFVLLVTLLASSTGAQTTPVAEPFVRPVASASSSPAGWTAGKDVGALAASADGLTLTLNGADPGVTTPPLDLPDGVDLWARLRVTSEVGGLAQLYFYRDAATEAASQLFELAAGKPREVLLPLPQGSQVRRLRLDPPGVRGRFTIHSLQIEEPSRRGVLAVVAGADHFTLTIAASDLARQLVEFRPSQVASYDLRSAARVAELPAGGERTIDVPRFDGMRDRLYSGFAVRDAKGSGVGGVRFATGIEAISRDRAPIPPPASIKGLQVQMVNDALALGVKQATLNVNLAQLIDLDDLPDSYRWEADGHVYRFRKRQIDAIAAKPLSDAGVQVTLILLNYVNADPRVDKLMRHPRGDPKTPNRVVGFNTATAEGVEQYRACVEFLADRFSGDRTDHGRVVGYIVGNEVNSHHYWYDLGQSPMEAVTAEYLAALRIAYTAIRRASAHARVYTSFDHFWAASFDGNRLQSIPGRAMLDRLTRLSRLGGDFDWRIAYHPYPEDLGDPRAWRDRKAPASPDAPIISLRNLEQLSAHLRRTDMLCAGQPRRIILSEQGFNAPDRAEGERWQAAAFCHGYVRASQIDGIDGLILHRHVDHRDEGGLRLGLWTRQPGSIATAERKKRLYNVFRLADTPEWKAAFEFALPEIGIKSWEALRMPEQPGTAP